MERRRRWWVWLVAAGVLAVAASIVLTRTGIGRSNAGMQAAAAPPVPIRAAPAATRDVGVYLVGLGAVTPLATVTVRTQVNGQLMSVRFQEGQLVNAGDLLAEIDPRPFEAQLTQFEGQLTRDQALLDNARIDLHRFQVLWSQNSVAKQQLDTQVSLVRQLEGDVQNDQGLIEGVKVQLIYCRITSPITGRVGLRLVDAGNFVQTTDTTGLVVITQLQPITVVFTIPEDQIPSVLDRMNRDGPIPVDAFDREQRHQLATGSLLTIDNEVDPSTGTVRLKAQFPNTDGALFPNQFVNARLQLDVVRRATVVPAAAIQQSPQGPFVYVVKADQTVETRPVTLGPADGDDVSVSAGVQAGELAVVDGAERLRAGSRVQVPTRSTT